MVIDIIESDGRRKIIGELKDRVFRKRVKGSIHLYRKLDAWGVDAEIFKDVLLGQADEIRVLDTEEMIVYQIDVDVIDKKGTFLHFKPHRAQIFLPRRYWKTYKPNTEKHGTATTVGRGGKDNNSKEASGENP